MPHLYEDQRYARAVIVGCARRLIARLEAIQHCNPAERERDQPVADAFNRIEAERAFRIAPRAVRVAAVSPGQ